MIELDLIKYGLSHLANKEICTWADADVDRLLDAFTAENIAPAMLGIPFSPHTVKKLLSISRCKRYGGCCLPNPIDPSHPGGMVYEEDLKLISKYSHHSYK